MTNAQQVVLDMLGLPGASGVIDLEGRIAVLVPFTVEGQPRIDRRPIAPATFAALKRTGAIYHDEHGRTFALPGAWIRNMHELSQHVRSGDAARRADRIAMLAEKLRVSVQPIRFESRVVGLVLASNVNVQFPIRAAAWDAAVKRAQVLTATTDTSPRT